MNARAGAYVLLLLPLAAAAHESRSASFRNLSAAGDAIASAPPASLAPRSLPAAPPSPLVRPAEPLTPAPSKPAPKPAGSAGRLWALTAAAAALTFGAAFLAARRKGARDESLAMAAHELKSPLSAIEAYLALMEQDGRSGAAGARAWLEDIGRMRTTAAHLRRTIGDILEMTRLEDGRLRLEPRDFDLTGLADECVRSYAALASSEGISVELVGEEARAHGDPARVRQVLDNLLGNALRHAAGRVQVSVRGGPRARVTVMDDGAGVPPAARKRLFRRFERLSSPARGDAGTGLGLYIGRSLAEASQGSLEHAPGPGDRGAAFTLTLPGASG